ncbi:MAG: TIGR03013 family PEP-CTERM/XrtA system glycosyltransferase [Nitrospirae bacterium]|nr:TIGR03013 family PEP-CTERM/XrtA system glycosyltransferase [Nitrospirota bacterium]
MIRIFNHYVSVSVLLVLLGDAFFASLAVAGIFAFARFGPASGILAERGIAVGAVWVILSAFLFFQAGLYDTLNFEDDRTNLIRILSALLILAGIGFLVMIAFPVFRMGWKEALLLTGLTFIGILAWRRFVVLRLPFLGWKRRTLILGTFQISRIFEELNKFRHNIRIHGVVDAQKLKEFDLVGYALEHRIHSIVISLKDRRGTLPIHNILACKMHGIDVMEWATFYEKNTNKIDIMNINPSHLILGDGFQKNRLTVLVKGAMDRLLAFLGLVLFLPFGLVIALLIRLESPGPVFYSQERVGLNGRSFRILKFRSMVADAEKGLAPQWASRNDPRITRIGAFLRKTRLDEVPQLINILKGEMSFVGPRPERPFFVAELEKSIPFYQLRHVTKPGLSGWAQIRYRYGATVEDAAKKLEYDLYYIKNLSIFLDLMIFLETIQVILFGKGSR